ncbi:MAG: HEAT repeat domain-containing protein [Phycisphaerales bacterium]|nr:HEAT repeat domain-containing protein [Phycisphaerales bacterium]MCI0632271.1 HEAT repeat domain-containing protein [Phycisphaerales bacterium]MCI0674536.1 HEAT repeat domain-containing protein [Phycisphaerales bacterium]
MPVDLLYWSGGALLGLVGVGIALWALFADRSGGRLASASIHPLALWALFVDRSRAKRRCSKCWYDMSATAGLQCPECGRVAKRESKLYKTRRNWRWVMAGFMVILAASFLTVQPRVQRDGWTSLMPTTLLVLGVYMHDNQWAFDGLEKRTSYEHPDFQGSWLVSAENLWDWQLRLLGSHCVTLIESNEPPSKRRVAFNWLVHVMSARRKDDDVHRRMWGTLLSLLNDTDSQLREWAAIYSADPLDPQASIDRLLPLLGDPDVRIRRAGVTGMRVLGQYSDAPLPHLVVALAHADWEVRSLAASAIGSMIRRETATEDVLDSLADAFQYDAKAEVRARALLALSNFGLRNVKCREMIRAALNDPEPLVRAEALDALAMMDDMDVAFFVESALAGVLDAEPSVRSHAAWLLHHRIPSRELEDRRDVLVKLMVAEDEEVRSAAAYHLATLEEVGK